MHFLHVLPQQVNTSYHTGCDVKLCAITFNNRCVLLNYFDYWTSLKWVDQRAARSVLGLFLWNLVIAGSRISVRNAILG